MVQIFHRSTNTISRFTIFGALVVVAVAFWVAAQIQRSPYSTYAGVVRPQPVPFSHKHHVQGLGLQCQYCHVSVEKSSYAGIPPTKTCINCHAQIWTNAQLLEPVRNSWATGQSLVWTKVHDLPDFAYFSHEIHVNKGLGCSSCHGRVDQMPLMYAQNTLQMEWCLDCHRNPAKNLRPTQQVYNMAWEGPKEDSPVWCAVAGAKAGTPTAQSVSCVTNDPAANPQVLAELSPPSLLKTAALTSDAGSGAMALGQSHLEYQKFTSQMELGHFLEKQYHIRTPRELTSCEVCHR